MHDRNLTKILSKKRLLVVILSGFALSSVFVLHFILMRQPVQNDVVSYTVKTTNLYKKEEVKQEKVSYGLPVRLKIPKINVDAAIDHVGVTSKGDMGVPKVPNKTAWFNLGPRPGEKGSSVIDGHYGWEDGKLAVFGKLNKLQKGDNLYVEDEKGMIISFIVRESRKYDPEADATEVFRSNDGLAHLNLITCGGTWDKESKTYSKRLAVFTDKE